MINQKFGAGYYPMCEIENASSIYFFARIWVIPFACPVSRLIVAWIVTRKTRKRNSAPLSTTPTKAAATASKASKIVLCRGKSSGLGLCSFTAGTKSSTRNTCSDGSCSIHSRHIFHLLFGYYRMLTIFTLIRFLSRRCLKFPGFLDI